MSLNAIRWAAASLGILFLVAVLSRSGADLIRVMTGDPRSFLLACAVNAVSLALIALSWAVLRSEPRIWSDVRGFLVAQPAKHVPGGIALPIGQIAAAARISGSVFASTVHFVLHAAVLVTGGLVASTPLAFSVLSGVARFAVIAGACLLMVVLLNRSARDVAANALKVATKRWGRDEWAGTFEVEGMRVVASIAIASIGVVGLGYAFYLLSAGGHITGSVVQIVSGFCLAWTAGFVAVPLPAGLGLREAVLALVLPGAALAPAVAVSVGHRIAQLIAEAVLATLSLGGEAVASRKRS